MREDLESSGSGFGPDDEDGTEDDPEEKHKDKGSKPTLFNNKEDQSRNILPVNTRTNIEVPDIDIENTNSITNTVQKEEDSVEVNRHGNGVIVMNTKHEERATSFFAQPGILAGADDIGGGNFQLNNDTKNITDSNNNSYNSSIGVVTNSFNNNQPDRFTNTTNSPETLNILRSILYQDKISDHCFLNEEMMFFKSLQPYINGLDTQQKLTFKIKVLLALKNIISKH
ncbi:nuclear transcription factor Y subunit alpha isoform X2 [Cimex lectularius]|nr:nuclear transcription factor Y subunit alpha isoform X2 [Cimex lectularius]XP_024080769.1 nuclear transcription factor Y subunit alpha isoform X2 [Cimex lectularius]